MDLAYERREEPHRFSLKDGMVVGLSSPYLPHPPEPHPQAAYGDLAGSNHSHDVVWVSDSDKGRQQADFPRDAPRVGP